jgi:signal transduction histidine kinase
LVFNLQTCYTFVKESNPISLIMYSHIPTSLAALLIGIFVFVKNKKLLTSKALLLLSLNFAIWSALDLVTWVSFDSRLISFSWVLIYFFEATIFAVTLFFVYCFTSQNKVSLMKILIMFALLLPILFSVPTSLSVKYFDVMNCEAIQGSLIYYLYFLEILFSIWIIFVLIKNYIKAEKEFRKQIFFFGTGILLFLFAFSWANIIGNITTDWNITQYGLFGMPVFLGFLAYLIVRYKAFNIKLLAAQALVAGLIILIGSQFAFIQNNTNRILTAITLFLSTIGGWMLIRSVKSEVERKEELQVMADRLAQANDKLRTLDNAKSEFISIASHQLRTPLTAVKGFISLILEGSYGKISPKIREVINNVYISNERLVALVEDMLNLSRIESGRMDYNFEKVKLEDVVKEIYDTFTIRSHNKGLKLEIKLPETPLPEAMTDRNKIREVISNLVDNAIKYTEKGWVSVRLSQKGDSVQVAVADTGIGVPQEEMPYLFEKFSRGKDISRLNTGGTGLGLHVGKKMMEALHGRIRVESKGAGLGSTFFVEVPVEMEGEK